jgi:hypothetical protein
MHFSLKPTRRQRDTVRYYDIYPKPRSPRRRFPRLRLPLALGLVVLLLVSGLWVSDTLQADTVTLYPTACLGGWKNTERAQGELSTNAADVRSYTESSVATLPPDTLAEMFCGGFTAEFPPRSSPKSLTLLVAWNTEVEADPTVPIVTGDNFESSSGEVLDAPEGTEPEFKLIEPPQDAEVIIVEPDPEPAPEPAAESEPLSFLHQLIGVAHAQEDGVIPVPEVVSEPAPPTEVVPEPVPEGEPQANTEPTPQPTSPNAFLEVRYTLNGKDWESLGFYDAAHIVPTTFSIPLPENASWSDLTSFQISIRSNATLDGAAEVYLDGMELRIDYVEGVAPFFSDKTLYSTEEIITLTSEIPGSAVQIYWLDNPETTPEPSQVYAGIIGDDGTIQLEARTLFPGRFEFVNTTTRGHCSNLYLEDCLVRGAPGSVVITIGTPEQVALTLASSTAAIASSSVPIEEEASALDKIIDFIIGDDEEPVAEPIPAPLEPPAPTPEPAATPPSDEQGVEEAPSEESPRDEAQSGESSSAEL